MLIGVPAPVLSVHLAQKVRGGRVLRSRRHELEAFFVPKEVELVHLLRDGVASRRYQRTSSLFCEHYEVSFNLRVVVPIVVLYYGNYMHSAGDLTQTPRCSTAS